MKSRRGSISLSQNFYERLCSAAKAKGRTVASIVEEVLSLNLPTPDRKACRTYSAPNPNCAQCKGRGIVTIRPMLPDGANRMPCGCTVHNAKRCEACAFNASLL